VPSLYRERSRRDVEWPTAASTNLPHEDAPFWAPQTDPELRDQRWGCACCPEFFDTAVPTNARQPAAVRPGELDKVGRCHNRGGEVPKATSAEPVSVGDR